MYAVIYLVCYMEQYVLELLLQQHIQVYLIFKKDFIYLILETGEEGREKERERNMNVREKRGSVSSCTCPSGDLARNPGMCPDWELNPQPLRLQAGDQTTESHQPGLGLFNF